MPSRCRLVGLESKAPRWPWVQYVRPMKPTHLFDRCYQISQFNTKRKLSWSVNAQSRFVIAALQNTTSNFVFTTHTRFTTPQAILPRGKKGGFFTSGNSAPQQIIYVALERVKVLPYVHVEDHL